MPTNAEVLLDTSAAIPFLLTGHAAHVPTFTALSGKRLGLAGHAAFETFSVLTRLPDPNRVSAQAALHMLHHNFPHTVHLSAGRAARLFAQLAQTGVSGGAVYDALVAAAALEHRCILATRDQRAASTYRAIGVEVTLVE